MKNRKYMAALLILTIGAYGCGSPALAATTTISHPLYGENHTLTGQDSTGRPDGMDDASWAALMDDTIEYSEIPDLVEYRSIIGRTQAAMIDGQAGAMVQMTDALSSTISDLRDIISDLREKAKDSTSEEEKQAYLAQIKGMEYAIGSASGASGKDAPAYIKNSMESGISTLVTKMKQGLHPTKVALIAGMDSAFVGYQSLVELREMYADQVEMYEGMYERTVRQQALGSATALEVQQAKVNLDGAKLSLSDTEEKLRSVKDAIALTLGWNAADTAKVTIGKLPAYDASYMAGRNLEADIAEARLHNVAYGSAMGTVDKNITGYTATDIQRRSAEQDLNITMTELYNAAVQAGTDVESAQLGFRIADRQKASAERMLAAGMMSATDYKAASMQYIASKMQADMSAINASAAVLSYQNALQGIL